MRCQRHSKECTGVCTWCGRQLCRLCIGKTDGKKMYCVDCSGKIGDLVKEKQLDVIRKENEPKTKYFDFSRV